jgi:phosphocarrier protein HPr
LAVIEATRIEAEFTVKGELGLHARPAGRFVSLAGKFTSEIFVGRDGEWVNGRSVLSILSLAAAQGTVLAIRAEGDDSEEAVRALGALVEEPD